jgi:hypothetical protein
MNITSRFPRSSAWVDVIVEEYGTKVECSVSTIKEAEAMKEELMQLINDLDTYIEKKIKKLN